MLLERNVILLVNSTRHWRQKNRVDISFYVRLQDVWRIIGKGLIEIRGAYNQSNKSIREVVSEI